jgi:hypothetical protein
VSKSWYYMAEFRPLSTDLLFCNVVINSDKMIYTCILLLFEIEEAVVCFRRVTLHFVSCCLPSWSNSSFCSRQLTRSLAFHWQRSSCAGLVESSRAVCSVCGSHKYRNKHYGKIKLTNVTPT